MAQMNNVVALVTGASRGAGRGIALELGAAGATVYVTGRSIRGGPTTDNVPGTIDETARDVTDRGGRGIAVRCDHTIDADVESLTEVPTNFRLCKGIYLEPRDVAYTDAELIRSNFTLNLGLRYEYVSEPKEIAGRLDYGIDADDNNWEPRFGFAWSP